MLGLRAAGALALVALLAGACAQAAARDASGALSGRPPRVHRIAGSAGDMFANAYAIEGRQGIVVVDALLTRAASARLRRRLDSMGKPLLAVIVTHGHPDHYGGVAELVGGRAHVPVVAVAGVDQVIRRDDAMKGERLSALGIDWPARRAFPSVIVAGGVEVRFGDISLTAIDVGAAESDHDSIWLLRGPDGVHAFIGDLVMEGVHAYTADGHTGRWLSQLERLRGMLAGARLHPGHGRSGDVSLLDGQAHYLRQFRAAVAEVAGGRPHIDAADARVLQRRMVRFLGHDRGARWVLEGAAPVAAELVRR